MANWKEGDHVRVKTRPVTEEDRKKNRYFEHMSGLTGTVQNVYSVSEIGVRVDPESMSKVTRDVHKTATERMRKKFLDDAAESVKKTLTAEELEFDAHYVLLVDSVDLENV
jgi:ribosomal protein L21E